MIWVGATQIIVIGSFKLERDTGGKPRTLFLPAPVCFQNGRWNLIDHVVGPTEVACAGWPLRYGVPAALLGRE